MAVPVLVGGGPHMVWSLDIEVGEHLAATLKVAEEMASRDDGCH